MKFIYLEQEFEPGPNTLPNICALL